MDQGSLLFQALVYLAAGVIAAPVAKMLKLGSVLGYLIAGAVIGPFALDLVGQQADVMRFAEALKRVVERSRRDLSSITSTV